MQSIFDSDGNTQICNERIVCFNISRTWRNRERANLYECTRKYWRLNGERVGMPTWSLPYAEESLSVYSDLTVGTEPNVQNMLVAGSLKGSNWFHHT